MKFTFHFHPTHTLSLTTLYFHALRSLARWSDPYRISTFSSSVAKFFVANSCSYCHNSVLTFLAATCQAVRSESSLANKNLLLLSSGVGSSLAHSNSIYNNPDLPFCASMCQMVLPQLSMAKSNLLLNSSGVSWSLAYYRNLTNVCMFPPTSCCQVPSGLSVFILD